MWRCQEGSREVLSKHHPASFQPTRSTCVRIAGKGTARGRGPRGQESQTLGATAKRPQPAPTPTVPPAAPGPRVPGPGSQAALTQDATERPLPLYLGATRPHLVWRLFGHAAADPGHARHLAAAVHGPRRSDASHYRPAPAGLEPPQTFGQHAPRRAPGRSLGQSAGASHRFLRGCRPPLTSLESAERERGGETVAPRQPGQESARARLPVYRGVNGF